MSMAQSGGANTKELIRSVSGHSNNLMSEVAKVIIGKPENIKKLIYKLSEIEFLIKKNLNNSINLITDFILEQSTLETNN